MAMKKLQQPHLDRDWLTIEQAAAYLQRSKYSVRHYLKLGVLSSSQIIPRGHILISAVSIEKMMEKGRR